MSAAGPVGVEFATIAHALGAKVTIADRADRLMAMMDGEITACMEELFREWGIRILFGSTCDSIVAKNGALEIKMSTGETLSQDTVLFAAGRVANTEDLGLDTAGVALNSRGRIVGGRALSHLCGRRLRGGRCSWTDSRFDRHGAWPRGDLPCVRHSVRGSCGSGSGLRGLWHARGFGRRPHGRAVPRASALTTRLAERTLPVARAAPSPGRGGRLKLIFSKRDRKLVGVHCIGDIASEIVGIGQMAIRCGGTHEYHREHVSQHSDL